MTDLYDSGLLHVLTHEKARFIHSELIDRFLFFEFALHGFSNDQSSIRVLSIWVADATLLLFIAQAAQEKTT